jgi:hypothetical protein
MSWRVLSLIWPPRGRTRRSVLGRSADAAVVDREAPRLCDGGDGARGVNSREEPRRRALALPERGPTVPDAES